MTATTAGSPQPCCDEYAAMQRSAYGTATGVSRRGVLGGALALAGASTMVGGAVVTASPAMAASAASVLVVVSLRGGSDGLNMVVPHADPDYYRARPNIAIPSDRLLVKDGMFGLHPAMAALVPLWTAGQVATVHAAGLPVANRSHFDAMEEIEDADPGSRARVGWLNRLIGTTPGDAPLQGFSAGSSMIPTSLFGPRPAMSADRVEDVGLPGAGDEGWREASVRTLWSGNRTTLGRSMAATLTAIDTFGAVEATEDNRDAYPGNDLGRALATAARIIRGDVGVEVITVDQGDWDMHSGAGGPDGGWMYGNNEGFAEAVAAFLGDLGTQAPKVTLVTLSEFGRRVQENDNYGTDHGYGNVMFVAGAGVRGGYHGRWPGLGNSYDSDLTVTTDYRQVLADIVQARFGGASIPTVFPGLKRQSTGCMLGV
ncbi:DUF1501 domain-containing protein [Nocardioides sp.]|uniref:DUF1501 domain-containing protein n=1 Tax=Nocardioides sp. TaxID=35761 RepID=UPI001A1AEE46|nr:DUF1501 domain-containing protein [Nocardioides sp.]MBJ7359419.1 DUF1501 domain-containing protein [Nocardioides sp.]